MHVPRSHKDSLVKKTSTVSIYRLYARVEVAQSWREGACPLPLPLEAIFLARSRGSEFEVRLASRQDNLYQDNFLQRRGFLVKIRIAKEQAALEMTFLHSAECS